MNSMARRMFELVEPIGVIPYSADEPNEAMFALGFTNYWDTYFAGRAAPLGLAPAEVVDALFYNFAPGEVARHIPKVWLTTTPEAAIAARQMGCVKALRRILGDHVDSPAFARAADLLLKAATSAPFEGRPMYAALRAIPIPDDVVARLFHAASLLREHRGDGHIAALMIEGVGGLESHVLFALDMGMPAEKFGRIHHLPAAQLAAVIDGMRDRGLIGDDDRLTEPGRAVKQHVEALTDDLAAKPYESLRPSELDELMGTLEPLATRLLAAQDWQTQQRPSCSRNRQRASTRQGRSVNPQRRSRPIPPEEGEAMHQRVNRQVRLKSRPSDIPQADHFEIIETPVPDPSNGQVLVRNIYLSVDPAMRGWVSAVANYSEPVALGAVMRSLAVGRVEESRSSDFHPGEYVTGMFGWQDFVVVDAEAIERKVGGSGLPISTSLGVLGLNGLTAYFALLDIGQPKAGETVVVSTAAGAVGSCVGQIAKIKGCRTVGIAGGPDKVRVCREEFRYDSAVDYRADDFESALDAACPEGVDVYFDNTAGPISDSVMRRLAVGARVVICGTASIASWDPPPQGPRVERHLLVKRARMQGFLIFDHVQRSPEALRDLESWVRDGQIRYREDILDGIEQAPGSIAGLYRGENLGKRLIRIAPDVLPRDPFLTHT